MKQFYNTSVHSYDTFNPSDCSDSVAFLLAMPNSCRAGVFCNLARVFQSFIIKMICVILFDNLFIQVHNDSIN